MVVPNERLVRSCAMSVALNVHRAFLWTNPSTGCEQSRPFRCPSAGTGRAYVRPQESSSEKRGLTCHIGEAPYHTTTNALLVRGTPHSTVCDRKRRPHRALLGLRPHQRI